MSDESLHTETEVNHGGEPWWVVVFHTSGGDYASTTVDAPTEEEATAQAERVLAQKEGEDLGGHHNTRGPFPKHVPTEDREIRPKICGGCGLKRYCGNHPPMPPQTWWTLEDEDEEHRGWECIQCRTWTWMPKEESAHV